MIVPPIGKAFPLRLPPASEKAVAAQATVELDDEHEGRQHRCARHHARDGRAEQAEFGRAKVAEHEDPVAKRIDRNGHAGDRRADAGPSERGHYRAQKRGQHCGDRCPHQHLQEGHRARNHARVLPGDPHQRSAKQAHAHGHHGGEQAGPRCHAYRAAHFAHGMAALAQFGRNQWRCRTDKAGKRPDQQSEQRYRERGCGQRFRPEPRDEDHVDRENRHLQQSGTDERRGEPEHRAHFIDPAVGWLLEHRARHRAGDATWKGVFESRRNPRDTGHRALCMR